MLFCHQEGFPAGDRHPAGWVLPPESKAHPADPSWMQLDLTVGGKFPGAQGNLDLEYKCGIIGLLKNRRRRENKSGVGGKVSHNFCGRKCGF